jgi:hypothetical protein
MLYQTPIERFLEAMAAGLNGPDAEGKDLKVNLVLTDIKTSYVLWIENAVLHFKKAPPDIQRQRDAHADQTHLHQDDGWHRGREGHPVQRRPQDRRQQDRPGALLQPDRQGRRAPLQIVTK